MRFMKSFEKTPMTTFKSRLALTFAAGLGSLLLSMGVNATGADAQTPGAAVHDGQHDFDFNFGVWNTHIKRRTHPLSGSSDSIELEGTVTVRKVWDGRAQLEEIEADGPKGHWEGLTLFLYNPAAHQWSQTFVGSDSGVFTGGTIGSFHNGRGELYSQDTYDGRSILVRGVWSDIKQDSHRYEESYSDDGGKTWEAVFSANLTRKKSTPPAASRGPHEGSHDFDFDFGSWQTHSKRLMHPLAGANDWVEMRGATIVSKVWNGRANLAEFKADGPAGPLELLALRVYDPTTHQWSINFATPKVGTLGVPGVGQARNGRLEFYDQEPIDGKAVLVRFSIWGIDAKTARSEQAFSADGGQTWEVNWINDYSRNSSF
jgi:BNR/Asp-box repeat